MRELMEDEPRELHLAVAHERRKQGIVEVTQRGVGRDAGEVHVVTGRGQACGFRARVGFGEIAAVRDATGDREAPLPGRE